MRHSSLNEMRHCNRQFNEFATRNEKIHFVFWIHQKNIRYSFATISSKVPKKNRSASTTMYLNVSFHLVSRKTCRETFKPDRDSWIIHIKYAFGWIVRWNRWDHRTIVKQFIMKEETCQTNNPKIVFAFTNQPNIWWMCVHVFGVHFGSVICLSLIEFHLNSTDWQLCYACASLARNATNLPFITRNFCTLHFFFFFHSSWIIYAVHRKVNK